MAARTASALAWSKWTDAFVQRLRALGWIEGRTVAIEYRWAEGRSERYAEIAAEFVRLKVDVIVTSGGAVAAVKQATATIPIVFAVANDPLGSGLVASLSRPGGNVTGLSVRSSDLANKLVELLRDLLPNLRRLAVLSQYQKGLGSAFGSTQSHSSDAISDTWRKDRSRRGRPVATMDRHLAACSRSLMRASRRLPHV